jgi:hypothetical protein
MDFPVKIWVYQTTRDLQSAAGGRQVPNGHTLGQVGSSDAAIVSRETDFLNIIRHELVHVVVRRATRSDEQIAGNYTRFEVPPCQQGPPLAQTRYTLRAGARAGDRRAAFCH